MVACLNISQGELVVKLQICCRKDLLAHYGCVNAVEFSSDGGRLASGGDDRQAGTSCSPSHPQHEICVLLNDIDCAR